ncbi:hypothetical protein KAI12_04630 [Candidatus Bathyarchaeota archaeon]|nr:hypothetical protein [Candidatus Bathyarchaeota archaeon]
MGKAALTAPLYISVAWILMTSYQLFTETAVTSVVPYVNELLPSVGLWLVHRLDMIVFVTAFAWVFILSSVIPSVILGKERGVLAQFAVCLSLTFSSIIILDVLRVYLGIQVNQVFQFNALFDNPVLAVGYLSLPYALMFALDFRSRNRKKKKETLERLTETYLETAEPIEQKYQRA